MFCPECKAEYREGFTKCSDCNVDLVEKLADESASEVDPNIKFVELLQTNDMTDIVQIKSILDSEDIHYYIKGDLMSSIRPVDKAILMVTEDDAEKAKELLKNIKLNYFRFIFRKH